MHHLRWLPWLLDTPSKEIMQNQGNAYVEDHDASIMKGWVFCIGYLVSQREVRSHSCSV